jgi:hypothetical protein
MSTLLSSKDGVKSRKHQICCLCGERIEPGDIKDVRSGVAYDQMWTMHMHPECHAYEKVPGHVDPEWYEDIIEPAFDRSKAIEFALSTLENETTEEAK